MGVVPGRSKRYSSFLGEVRAQGSESTPASGDKPALVVFSTLFPNPAQPRAGLFIRERMFRVGRVLPLTVVAPVPWFPFQSVIRLWRPHFRPPVPACEVQEGVEVLHPRFLSVPALFKSLDGFLMALGSLPALWRLRRQRRLALLDAHFGYPDGYAASLLARWLGVPMTLTLRGTEVRHAASPALRPRLCRAVRDAALVFCVSDSLRQIALRLGADPARSRVVANGVDTDRFHPLPRAEARAQLGLPADVPVLVSVGGLTERKGFHRVIELLPQLRAVHPGLVYLVVGGPSAEGDWRARLAQQVRSLGVDDAVRFLGEIAPDALKLPLSAADLFVLASRNEGCANVLLEAMACGLPVVATDVGGNREVVADPSLGEVVPFGDPPALAAAICRALATAWNREAIRRHAEANGWEPRVDTLCSAFIGVAAGRRTGGPAIPEQAYDRR